MFNMPLVIFLSDHLISMLPQMNESSELLCESLFNKSDTKRRHFYNKMDRTTPYRLKSREYYMNTNCETLRRGFVMKSTEEENNFGIAYSIMVYKDVEQLYRLLRSIYRPSNYYCIHVDTKVNIESCIALEVITIHIQAK